MAWDFETDAEFQELLDWADAFVREEVEPLDLIWPHLQYTALDETRRRVVDPLKEQVRRKGLWATHLGPELGGQGYGQLKLALLNEILGRSQWAPIIFGCQAPDTGNAEIIAHYGTPDQKEQYLRPLLNGEVFSCYSMTEPQGGADPTQFTTSAVRDGDDWVINGYKFFSSNASSSTFLIVMVVTNPDVSPYQGMSMFLVPTNTPGVNIIRNSAIYGESDGHGSHALIHYDNVRVPNSAVLGGEGQAFVIAQTRLGGGRIHHAMRTIGLAQKALDMMCERALSRHTAGSLLADKQAVQGYIADSWAQLQQFRLLVLHTAWKIDKYNDYKLVRKDIAAVKVVMPTVLHDIAWRAMQIHGALGVTNEVPFLGMVAGAAVMGLADGPTEVHKVTVAKQVLRIPAAVLMPLMMLILNIATIAILWFGSIRIDRGEMQVGGMMAFLQYLAPTVQFLLGYFVYREPFDAADLREARQRARIRRERLERPQKLRQLLHRNERDAAEQPVQHRRVGQAKLHDRVLHGQHADHLHELLDMRARAIRLAQQPHEHLHHRLGQAGAGRKFCHCGTIRVGNRKRDGLDPLGNRPSFRAGQSFQKEGVGCRNAPFKVVRRHYCVEQPRPITAQYVRQWTYGIRVAAGTRIEQPVPAHREDRNAKDHASAAAHRHRAWIDEQLYGARRRFADTFVRWDHVVADARAFVQPLIDNAGRAATSFTAADAVGYPTSPRLRQRVLDQALTATAAERNGNHPVASRPLTRLREWVEYTATDPTLPLFAWLRRLPHRWADEMAKCPPRSLSSSAQTSSSDRSSSTPSLRRNGCSAAVSSTATVPPRAAAVSQRVIRTFIRHDPTSDPCPL